MFMSCEGPQGPPGFDGFDGFDGADGADGADGLIGTIFEVDATFASDDGYEYLVDIPVEIEVFDTDIVIAYTLTEVNDGVDIWEPLPQTIFLDNEILLYGYDHTLADVRFFLDGTIALNTLESKYTDNIIFRVAVIPAAFAESIDVLNINEVMDAMQLKSIKRIK
jgi:hypothetical protein